MLSRRSLLLSATGIAAAAALPAIAAEYLPPVPDVPNEGALFAPVYDNGIYKVERMMCASPDFAWACSLRRIALVDADDGVYVSSRWSPMYRFQVLAGRHPPERLEVTLDVVEAGVMRPGDIVQVGQIVRKPAG